MPRRRTNSALSTLAVVCALLFCAGCGGLYGGGTLPQFSIYWSVAVADLNGDGKLDIAAGFTQALSASSQPGFASVSLQDPANPGTFLAATTYAAGDAPGGNDPSMLAIADLNGDGKPDLVTANSTRGINTISTGISVFLHDSANPGHFLAATNYDTGNQPAAVAIGDLNGDGKLDIAIADDNGVSIFLQDPTTPGSFLSPTTIAVSSGTSSVAIADLNSDGKLDLVATNGTRVLVFLQDPSTPGTFFAPASYGAGLQPINVAVGDLNGDGKPDLAVANLGSPSDGTTASVSVLLQNPAIPGTFFAATDYSTDSRSEVVAISDLNGDGKPDLVVANAGNLDFSGSSVSVLLQDPAFPGQFLPTKNYPGPNGVLSVAIGDLNGDGKPDLVLADGGAVTVRLQDATHPGQFLAETTITK